MIWMAILVLLALAGVALTYVVPAARSGHERPTAECAICRRRVPPGEGHSEIGTDREPHFVCDRCTWPSGI